MSFSSLVVSITRGAKSSSISMFIFLSKVKFCRAFTGRLSLCRRALGGFGVMVEYAGNSRRSQVVSSQSWST